jgi:hypothetical protein
MSTERELQRKMADFLRRRRDLGQDDEAKAFALAHLGDNPRLSGIEMLEIYREQFWLRHTASLVEDFPGVGGIIGSEDWNRLAVEYLLAHRPETFTLRDLGAKLPEFVATRAWLEQPALVADMARLEWAHVEVFDAADVPSLDPKKLAAVPEDAWEGARLVPDPALRLLRLEYPVIPLRRRLLASEEHDHENEGEHDEIPLPEPARGQFAVHRRERGIFHDALDLPAYSLLDRLVQGRPLGVACEEASQTLGLSVEVLGGRLEGWFAEWARLGYVVDVVTD